MKDLFESAAGSVVGTDHRKPLVWKNNQDAFTFRQHDDLFVAVVADGCGGGNGGGAYSEFGARLGAHLLAHRLAELFAIGNIDSEHPFDLLGGLERLRISLIDSLTNLAHEFEHGSRTAMVMDHFLFTLIALVITQTTTYVFGIGDGVYAINGEVTRVGPFENNMPPYLAYGGLVQSTIPVEQCKFAVHRMMPTDDLQSALIGTDGVSDLIGAKSKTLPGRKELVGPLSQFWENDNYFKIPDGVRRRLNQINNSVLQPNWDEQDLNEDHGRLKDDTTLVVVRRRKDPK